MVLFLHPSRPARPGGVRGGDFPPFHSGPVGKVVENCQGKQASWGKLRGKRQRSRTNVLFLSVRPGCPSAGFQRCPPLPAAVRPGWVVPPAVGAPPACSASGLRPSGARRLRPRPSAPLRGPFLRAPVRGAAVVAALRAPCCYDLPLAAWVGGSPTRGPRRCDWIFFRFLRKTELCATACGLVKSGIGPWRSKGGHQARQKQDGPGQSAKPVKQTSRQKGVNYYEVSPSRPLSCTTCLDDNRNPLHLQQWYGKLAVSTV